MYIIEDLLRGKRIKTHIHNLRPCVYDPAYTNPTDIAQSRICGCMNIRPRARILAHHQRSSMELLVQWAGYGENNNSLELYKLVDSLHDYLR